MAVRALRLVQHINRLFTPGLVTLSAFQGRMLPFQTKRALLMRLPREERWFKTRLVMTRRTIRPRDARGELAFMYVLVAVLAASVRHRTVEVGVLMALCASCRRVFPD